MTYVQTMRNSMWVNYAVKSLTELLKIRQYNQNFTIESSSVSDGASGQRNAQPSLHLGLLLLWCVCVDGLVEYSEMGLGFWSRCFG